MDTFQYPSEYRNQVRKLGRGAARGRVGAVALSTNPYGSRVVGPEYQTGSDVPALELLRNLSDLATKEGDVDPSHAGLLVSSNLSASPESGLIHPVQLRHYAEYAGKYEGAIGGSVSALYLGQIGLILFARKTEFNPSLLEQLDEQASPAAVAEAIESSGLVTVHLQFDGVGMAPHTPVEDVNKLF